MTSGQRARYYRVLHAAENEALEHATAVLRRQVERLEFRLGLQRQLVDRAVPPDASHCILAFVREFIEHGIRTRRLGLQDASYDIELVAFQGDAHAPIVRVDASLRGRLTSAVVHTIYPCVLGDSSVLDALIHETIRYDCSYVFFFSVDGELERERVEVSTLTGLRPPLQRLETIARVLAQVNVLPDIDQLA